MLEKADDNFLCGVLCALGFVYDAGEETTAEEIVSQVGAYSLLKVAQKNEDIFLSNLRKTIRFLHCIRKGRND